MASAALLHGLCALSTFVTVACCARFSDAMRPYAIAKAFIGTGTLCPLSACEGTMPLDLSAMLMGALPETRAYTNKLDPQGRAHAHILQLR